MTFKVLIVMLLLLPVSWGETDDAKDVKALMAYFQEELTNLIKETQKTLQADIKEIQEKISAIDGLQQCSTKAQLSQFQDKVFKDPCEDGSHNCSDMSTCTDYINRYECSCLPGYSGDGFTCQDVDECREEDIRCPQNKICINNPGSYRCLCPSGYKKVGDICQDVDECSENSNICGDHGTCRNNPPGSYTCTCDKYFRNVGNINCQRPVCESSFHRSLFFPSLGCLTFVRERLFTWDEGKSFCQEMGGRMARGIHRRDFQELRDHFGYVYGYSYSSWVGLRRRQWIHEEEEEEEEEEIQEEDWLRGEPDGGPDEECGSLFLGPGGDEHVGLGDFSCSRGSFYLLCQSLP